MKRSVSATARHCYCRCRSNWIYGYYRWCWRSRDSLHTWLSGHKFPHDWSGIPDYTTASQRRSSLNHLLYRTPQTWSLARHWLGTDLGRKIKPCCERTQHVRGLVLSQHARGDAPPGPAIADRRWLPTQQQRGIEIVVVARIEPTVTTADVDAAAITIFIYLSSPISSVLSCQVHIDC